MPRLPLAAAFGLAFATLPFAAPATEIVVQPVEVTEMKALFGKIESRFTVPARSRIGGTLVRLDVAEGSPVTAGQVIGRVADEKLELQLAAAEARLRAAQSQLDNARTELTRNEELLARGATTAQRMDQIRTTLSVAQNTVAEGEAARQVIVQQMEEGALTAPAAGRVISVPIRPGEVVMPGEAVATIAGGSMFLRLELPERHGQGLEEGAAVSIGEDGATRTGRIEKIYPLIEDGRVTVDVAVEGLDDGFVGKRVLVRVPIGARAALAVPQQAIRRSAGLDLVTLRSGDGVQEVTVVPGPLVDTPAGPQREILSGLRAGDAVVLP